ADCNARIADSRPGPGPLTVTSTVFKPCSIAVFEAVSEAICAANGVDFFEPLNPNAPAEDHDNALPKSSVIVTIVLLNVERMLATPLSIFFFTLRLRDTCLRAIYMCLLYLLFFLVRYCFNWSFTRTRIVLSFLTTNW